MHNEMQWLANLIVGTKISTKGVKAFTMSL